MIMLFSRLLCIFSLTASHEAVRVMFAVREQGLTELQELVGRVSDPTSSSYGKFLSREEVAVITHVPEAYAGILSVLNVLGIRVLSKSLHKEFIVAEASKLEWAIAFPGIFIEHILATSLQSVSIPEELKAHVAAVFNLDTELPMGYRSVVNPLISSVGTTTPKLINSFYGIKSNIGSSSSSQGIYAKVGNTYSDEDLATFQTNFNLPLDPVVQLIDGTPDNQLCMTTPSACSEGNLDVQYLLAISQTTPTTVFFDDTSNFILGWIITVLDTPSPSQVYSISWAVQEDEISADYVTSFNTQALKLSAMGVTLVASSGDDGVSGRDSRTSKNKCKYAPLFPASSIYVVSVGGTQGPELGLSETVCQSD
jgi:tripeptidyl-peptidase-1